MTNGDDTKYYAMVLTMAAHMADGDVERAVRERALTALVDAVTEESRRRARCRDCDAEAAVRVRSRW